MIKPTPVNQAYKIVYPTMRPRRADGKKTIPDKAEFALSCAIGEGRPGRPD
ncbi:MAG: hypothetical protein U1F70_09765 [Candidatus Competibacteraceae bacterium]